MGAIYPRISGAANVVAGAARRFAGAKAGPIYGHDDGRRRADDGHASVDA
jgi:hypothetical protein